MLKSLLVAVAMAASAPAPVHDSALAAQPFFQNLGAVHGLPSSSVCKLAQDCEGFQCVGAADRLARYNGVGLRVYRHDASYPTSLSGNEVTALFIDRDNRIWCGGEGAGMNLLDTQRASFRRGHGALIRIASSVVLGRGMDAFLRKTGDREDARALRPARVRQAPCQGIDQPMSRRGAHT